MYISYQAWEFLNCLQKYGVYLTLKDNNIVIHGDKESIKDWHIHGIKFFKPQLLAILKDNLTMPDYPESVKKGYK